MPALIGAAVVGGGALIGAGVSHGLERRRQKKRSIGGSAERVRGRRQRLDARDSPGGGYRRYRQHSVGS